MWQSMCNRIHEPWYSLNAEENYLLPFDMYGVGEKQIHARNALEGISKTVGTICALFANSSTARRILNSPI